MGYRGEIQYYTDWGKPVSRCEFHCLNCGRYQYLSAIYDSVIEGKTVDFRCHNQDCIGEFCYRFTNGVLEMWQTNC